MKNSIKTQLILTFVCLVTAILGVNLLINNFFLEKYYIYQKQNDLIQIYEEINTVENIADYQSDSFEEMFRQISSRTNVDMTILWPDTDYDGSATIVFQSMDSRVMRGRIEGYLFGFISANDKQEVLKSTDNYTIQKCEDSVAKMDYLESWGKLDTGCYFLLRIPIQSIRDSVKIANRFSSYLILFGMVAAVLMIWWRAGRITEPVQELTRISRRMAQLDFDARYTSGGDDEIGELGDNFNQMSEILEKTISELKTANNELLKDLEKKEQIDEMRKEFLSNVSHELKTPIALIQGYAEGLKECINDDAESREFYCDVIMDEAAKMNNMVRKLLSLNQLESGNDVINIERFDLTELITGVVQSSLLPAEQKGAKIHFEGNRPVHVWGDEFKVEEVITNYISNALNHVEGAMHIDILVGHINQKVRVAVFNTGKNIPEEDLDKIWIKFYKVDKARTREYGGNGIGLSIVKAIMDSMHQAYGVENRPDGVTFWFELESAD